MIDSLAVTRGAITVLSWGWRISFAFIVVGLALALVRDQPLATELGTLGEVMDDLLSGRSNGFLGIGILAMILSPIVATATIALNFFRVGDRRYGIIASTVFGILMVSILMAIF